MRFLFFRQLAINVENKISYDSAKEKVNACPSDNRIVKVGAVKKKHKPQYHRAQTRPISLRHRITVNAEC